MIDPNNTDSDKDHGKRRKIDSDGFACPNTPDGHRTPYSMHASHSKEGACKADVGYEEVQSEAITSEYFQHTEDSTHIDAMSTECKTSTEDKSDVGADIADSHEAEQAVSNMLGSMSNYNYEESRPEDMSAGYHLEKVDNYNYVSHAKGQEHRPNEERASQSHGQLAESENTVSSYGYERSDSHGQIDSGYYQQQTAHPQGETYRVEQPGATGAASAAQPSPGYVDEALKRWKEEGEQLFDYWSNIFRLSQDYEVKAIEKLGVLMEKAKELDQTLQQHREAVMQRVQGIGKILEL